MFQKEEKKKTENRAGGGPPHLNPLLHIEHGKSLYFRRQQFFKDENLLFYFGISPK